MQEQLIIHCEDSIDGIYTAIYEGFCHKKTLEQREPYQDSIRICPGDETNGFLFAKDIFVSTDQVKAQKTVDAIIRRLGYPVHETLFHALCHFDEERATIAFGFLTRAFPVGGRIMEHLSDPYVMRIMELRRKVYRETDKLRGFVRFQDTGSFLYAQIEPKCYVLPILADHFADRYPGESFMIHDRKHRTALLHPAGRPCFLSADSFLSAEWLQENGVGLSDPFEALWKQYFHTAAIEARKNERCQRNTAPIWYRKHMLEFEENSSVRQP